MSHQEALEWISRVLVRSRGKEPIGNYNPLIIGELFWERSSKWKALAEGHVDQVADMCKMCTNTLLEETCPKDVRTRLSELKVKEALESRKARATAELLRIVEDKQDFPAVYNHYYTDNVQKSRNKRKDGVLSESIKAATTHQRRPDCNSNHTSATVDVAVAIDHYHGKVDHDMEKYSCEEALDCLLSIYKVSTAPSTFIKELNSSQVHQKTFVANIAAQVIERHMVRGLDKIFSPVDVNNLSDEDVLKVAAEPPSVKRQRDFLQDRQKKLLSGKDIFREILGRVR